MEKSSAFTESRKMSDVALARNLIAEIAGHCWRGKGDMLERVYRAVSDHYPQWTRRRLRSFWHREAAGVRYHEMIELAEVARLEKEQRERIEEARSDHAKFIANVVDTMERMATGDEEFYSAHRSALRQMAGGSAHRPVGNAAGERDIDPALGRSHIRKIDE